MKRYQKALFLFHRDLRVEDNRALAQAIDSAEKIVLCFIFDEKQVTSQNAYKSNNALLFLVNSLKELFADLHKKNIKPYLFYGQTQSIIEKILIQEQDAGEPLGALFSSRDYTPFSIKRDQELEKLCRIHHCNFVLSENLLLHEPEDVIKETKDNKNFYTVFTPFYKKAALLTIQKPISIKITPHNSGLLLSEKEQNLEFQEKILAKICDGYDNKKIVTPGRKAGLQALKRAVKLSSNYALDRDYPAKEQISYLSSHHKFGTLSIRETFWALKEAHPQSSDLTRQLYWRDFFTHIAFHVPHVFGHAFNEKYEEIKWSRSTNSEKFHRWTEGKTGFPIVDAGMRELTATGFMHNRLRMIVASFLTKDLHIHWLLGERYFAQHLVDYDPAVNNGNWQWAASTGCDAQPYFRIFNPWLQQKKFDPEAQYIKKWIPELNHLSAQEIHEWETLSQKKALIREYPAPCLDHNEAKEKTLTLFKVNLSDH